MQSRDLRYALRYAVILIVETAADIGIAILKRGFGENAEGYRGVF